MIINKTYNLMGDKFSKKIKFKSLVELGLLILMLLLKYQTNIIDNYFYIFLLVTIINAICFLYHLYLIIFYDLRLVFITRLMKQNFKEATNHLKLFQKNHEDDLHKFSEKLNFLTLNLFILNNSRLIYTSNFITSNNIKLLFIIHTKHGKEYLYEVDEE